MIRWSESCRKSEVHVEIANRGGDFFSPLAAWIKSRRRKIGSCGSLRSRHMIKSESEREKEKKKSWRTMSRGDGSWHRRANRNYLLRAIVRAQGTDTCIVRSLRSDKSRIYKNFVYDGRKRDGRPLCNLDFLSDSKLARHVA